METDRFLCSVCLERFVQPRITKCGHTFCENCLFTFVFETQRKTHVHVDLDQNYFACPFCRENLDLPMTDVTLGWIQDTFPPDFKVLKDMASETESSAKEVRPSHLKDVDNVICAPCKESGCENTAVKFCLNCCEALCKMCCEWHKKFKLFKQHNVVTLTDAGLFKTQTFTEKIERCTKCGKHSNRSCVSFCTSHQQFCCIQCITNEHRLCEVLNVSDVGDKAKQKASHVYEMYQNFRAHTEVLLSLKEDATKSLLADIDEMSEGITSIKNELIASLNREFSEVMTRLKDVRTNLEDNGKVGRLTELRDECEKEIEFLKALECCNSNEHVFLLSQAMQIELTEKEKELRKFDTSMKRGILTIDICNELSRLKEKLKSDDKVISIHIETVPLEHQAYEEVEDLVHDFRVQHLTPVSLEVSNLASPLFSSIDACGENLVLLDRCSSELYCYNISNKSSSTFRVWQAYDVLHVENQSVLISKPDLHSLSLIKLAYGRPSNTLSWKLKAKPYTLYRLEDNTYITATQEPVGFQILKISREKLILENHLTNDITGKEICSTEYFAADAKRKRLIQSRQEHNDVCCLTFEGEHVFCFRNPALECPQGVAVDKNGSIYVCNHSYFKPSVLILSTEGILLHEIKDSIPRKPLSICSDASRKRFWLTSNYIESSSKVYGFELVKITQD